MKHNMTHEEREDLYHWYNEAKDGKISDISVTCRNSELLTLNRPKKHLKTLSMGSKLDSLEEQHSGAGIKFIP